MSKTLRIALIELCSTVGPAHDLVVTGSNAKLARPMPRPATQRQAQAELTRRKLLDAAVEHFSARHFDDVATSDITETAGVAQGLLFHYFGNKRGIYLEALRDAANRLNAANTPPPTDGSAGEQFRQMLRAHLAYFRDHDGLALRLVLGGSGGDPEAWEIFDQSRWQTIEWTCRLLGLDVTRPALRLMLRSCAGALDEATTYWLKNERPFDPDAMVEAIVELLVTSLRCAAQLDPEIDVSDAVAKLADPPHDCCG
jgi:AcrR family transcriptional regulator